MKKKATKPTRALTRRAALGSLAAGSAALAFPLYLPSRLFGENAPSKQITLGFIGVGLHGLGHNLNQTLQQPDAKVLAVCDVYASRAEKAQRYVKSRDKSEDCKTYSDFREVLARKDIDAVVISTPDHWHVPLSLAAARAGKDVFCEKPTLTIAEGRELVNVMKQHDVVYQAGLEDRATDEYHRMAQIVRNGGIGTLQSIDVYLPEGTLYKKEEPAPVPADLNWNLWLGPAPFAPYSPRRTEPQAWRNIRDYSGGKLTDWGAHLLDTALVANFAQHTGPVEVSGKGEVPANAMNSVPSNYDISYRFANGVTLRVRSGKVAIRFEGSAGWVGNQGWRTRLEASSPEILKMQWPSDKDRLWARPPLEHRNFLDCVKSRKATTYPPEDIHRLSTTMHLANIAMELGRKLTWDPKTEAFKDNDAANVLRSRESRQWA
ncbi:MAG: Gfo/Idh/MocA family oxidoreductase [Phycisphaeraceae bacterium]